MTQVIDARKPNSQHVYQYLHTRKEGYSDGALSPGLQLKDKWLPYTIGSVLDLGCGKGDVPDYLYCAGFNALGVDWANIREDQHVHDITKPLLMAAAWDTITCFDVLEHIAGPDLPGVFENLARCRQRAIISIHNGHTMDMPGVELHVTRQPFSWWMEWLTKYFSTFERIVISDIQELYICTPKEDR
jgi:SAM-dependent methyltransferase